jgi:NTP pyrophosphatase (non-canonical NTP hydrolase)
MKNIIKTPPELKKRLPEIKTLAMIKMEKNFIAQEKGYSRQPYYVHSISECMDHLEKELNELKEGIQKKDLLNIKEEIADMSNLLDYLFEKTVQIEVNQIRNGHKDFED